MISSGRVRLWLQPPSLFAQPKHPLYLHLVTSWGARLPSVVGQGLETGKSSGRIRGVRDGMLQRDRVIIFELACLPNPLFQQVTHHGSTKTKTCRVSRIRGSSGQKTSRHDSLHKVECRNDKSVVSHSQLKGRGTRNSPWLTANYELQPGPRRSRRIHARQSRKGHKILRFRLRTVSGENTLLHDKTGQVVSCRSYSRDLKTAIGVALRWFRVHRRGLISSTWLILHLKRHHG